MSSTRDIVIGSASRPRLRLRRALLATTAALSLGAQNAAWAVCSDGTTLPGGGYVVGQAPVQTAANWSANVFTAPAGSIFVPDNSVNELNDPAQAADRRRTQLGVRPGLDALQGDETLAARRRRGHRLDHPAEHRDRLRHPADHQGRPGRQPRRHPLQGEAITPTCDPTKLSAVGAPNPANTYFNQLGCSISHGVATTANNATTYLFVAGIKGGLFSIPLNNVFPTGTTPPVGSDAGKINGAQNYYSDIPEGQKLTNAAVSPDGMFAMATSIRRAQYVYACLNPLGDPGDPSTADQPELLRPAGRFGEVHAGRQQQPGGRSDHRLRPRQPAVLRRPAHRQQLRRQPGSSALNPVPSAWPQCTFNGVRRSDRAR